MKVQSFLFNATAENICHRCGCCVGVVCRQPYHSSFNIATLFFLIAAIIQVLLTKLAIGIYLYPACAYSAGRYQRNRVHATQHKLAQLKSSTLWVARLLFCKCPCGLSFTGTKFMLENGNAFLYIVQAVVTLAFTYIAVWLFLNIKYENRNKNGSSSSSAERRSPVIKSMELLPTG